MAELIDEAAEKGRAAFTRARDPMLALVKAFMGERSHGTLQMQVEILLMPWINAKRKAASSG
jgi:hypothetical protein